MSRTRLRPLFGSVVLLLVATGGAVPTAAQDPVTLRFETWRTEDQKLWEEQIIPVFEASHPNIKISYEPTVGTEYDAALTTRFSGGVAGDVIACRAFDGSLKLFNEGYLTPVDAIPGVMENFSDSALTAWRTDDQSTTFCVPMGGSIHGFIYNQAIFDELKLTPPTTQEEFIAVLEAIKAEGSYTPLAMGAADTWTVGTMGYESIGPNYWKGEEGRNGLIDGTAKFTDPEFVGPFGALAAWNPYLPDGYEAVTYSDAQQLFTLGRAVIYPSGSWEIAGFNDQVDFPMGFFKAPLVTADQTPCYTNFHTDIGIENAQVLDPNAPQHKPPPAPGLGRHPRDRAPRRGQGVPRVGRHAGVRQRLRQRRGRTGPAHLAAGGDRRPAAQGVRGCHDRVREHHPVRVSEALARRAQHEHRGLAGRHRGDQRQDDAGRSRRHPPDGPRQLVHARRLRPDARPSRSIACDS